MFEGRWAKATVHVVMAVVSLGLVYATGENPRALLYAYIISQIYLVITVWIAASGLDSNPLSALLLLWMRKPVERDRGWSLSDKKTGRNAGIISYIIFILNTAVVMGVPLVLWHGLEFLEPRYIFPELAWAVLLAVVLWCDDLFGRSMVVDPEREVHENLGYNAPALVCLTLGLLLGGILMFPVVFAFVAITGAETLMGADLHLVTWTHLVVLACLKLAYQLSLDFESTEPGKKKNGFKQLSRATNNRN